MIVVDTTVWLDFFNGAGTPEDLHLQQLITAERSLALTDLIFCEILSAEREKSSPGNLDVILPNYFGS
jgi:predicted nucleic acid-binding protein